MRKTEQNLQAIWCTGSICVETCS